jgi:hypothetical protein
LSSSQSRLFRIIAVTHAVAALLAPAGAFAQQSTNPNLRNDIAHFPPSQGRLGSADQSPSPIVVNVDGGFDWTAAAVGAAGGLGLVLVAGGAASALRRRQPADEVGA